MPDKKLTDSEIVKALDEAELFLRNRVMDGQSLKLNEYDIGILRNISQTCAKAYDEINRLQAENEAIKKPKPKFHRTLPDSIPIREYTALIERYNKKHGTCYTYGQFVSLLNQGKIPRRVLNEI